QSLEPIVLRNWTNPRPLAQFSAGERARLHLAVDLPLQDLVNQASKTGGVNLYVNDELLASVDNLGIANIARSFERVNKTIFLVTHSAPDLTFEHALTLEKKDNVTTIV